jgi:hypothetical protein
MLSLFNPYVLLGIIFAILSAFGWGYYQGQWTEFNHQLVEIQQLNEKARAKEQALTTAVNTTANALRTSNEKAKLETQKLHTALDSGALRLRIPVKASNCPVQTATDATPASGNSVQATAELDRETAKSLVAITDQGDVNTRQLNACIDAYNAAYQTLKGKP